jgi:hypothetical protein
MSNFATLKKTSSSLDRLAKEIEKINSPATEKRSNDDPRFWKLERDKSGNGSAVIRFLPAPEVDGDDALPWVRYFDHGFKGPTGKWYIENSLTSLSGQKDPVSEYNSTLWNMSVDDNSPSRKQARVQKRRLHYVSNIYVESDPKHPENEGRVFLYKFGKRIFDKIHEAMYPPFDEKGRSQEHAKYDPTNAFNPFDMWKGASFKIRIRTVDGYPNYDQSTWSTQGPLNDDDGVLEKLWKSEYSLREIISPDKFKSYDELKRHLDDVLELSTPSNVTKIVAGTPQLIDEADDASLIDDLGGEEDEDLKAFKALANQ